MRNISNAIEIQQRMDPLKKLKIRYISISYKFYISEEYIRSIVPEGGDLND